MTELIITRGVPASGKTTWAKDTAWVWNYVRVNRDDLRQELHLKHGDDEQLVSKIQQSRVRDLLENGVSVILDDTNLVARYVKQWLKIAAEANAEVEFKDFPISYEAAVQRDEARDEAYVGEEVIKSFFDRFIRKGKLPPIPTLTDQDAQGQFQPYAEVEGLPWTILIDIDGTLAHMTGRSPYDPTRYHEDTYDEVIAELANDWSARTGGDLIIMSGRDSEYRTPTENWLARWGFQYQHLFMRPQGDKRNDAIVKNELFEEHIAGRYNVDFILDDRDRVVKMWRAKGLKCLQVADGNF